MKRSPYRSRLSGALVLLGGIAMLVGALDPLEGSVVILPGSGLLALGAWLGHANHRMLTYRVWVFILVAFGVGALWGLSAVGGVGGKSEHSMWWGALTLPYLIGWSMGIWGPGSPRWMLWLGMAVSGWYLAIALMIQIRPDSHHSSHLVSIVLAALGLLTIGGCIHRLRKRLAVQ